MKKTFSLAHPKLHVDRVSDSVKNEIKKYFKRERKKTLPDDVDYWDFDCKFGHTEAEAKAVFPSEINKAIDAVVAEKQVSFYVEVLAKPGYFESKLDFDEDE